MTQCVEFTKQRPNANKRHRVKWGSSFTGGKIIWCVGWHSNRPQTNGSASRRLQTTSTLYTSGCVTKGGDMVAKPCCVLLLATILIRLQLRYKN